MNIAVFEVSSDERAELDRLSRTLDVNLRLVEGNLSMDTLSSAEGCEAVSTLGRSRLDRELLNALRAMGVGYVSTRTIGVDHIDLAAAKEAGIRVSHASYPPDAVADFTIMLMLMVLRRYKPAMWRQQVNDYTLTLVPSAALTLPAGTVLSIRAQGVDFTDAAVSDSGFSVSNGKIRYGLSAIKSLGKPVIDAIVAERKAGGTFKSLKDFVERLSSKEVNKRTVESFIKAGAFDSLHATRKQMMLVYISVIDGVNQEKKKSISGQMSLFDMMEEEEKQEYELNYPDVGEYKKEQLLAMEKEVLGIYASGHPLEEYADTLQKMVTATTADFLIDSETGTAKVQDQSLYIIGGLISNKTVKMTRNNQNMAFLTIEDLYGTVEVVVFPRDYEKYKEVMNLDEKVYIRGRASVSEEEGKMICEMIVPFNEVPKEIWIQFQNKEQFNETAPALYRIFGANKGNCPVVIYCKEERALNRLPRNLMISGSEELLYNLSEKYGKDNVKVVEKSIENLKKIH